MNFYFYFGKSFVTKLERDSLKKVPSRPFQSPRGDVVLMLHLFSNLSVKKPIHTGKFAPKTKKKRGTSFRRNLKFKTFRGLVRNPAKLCEALPLRLRTSEKSARASDSDVTLLRDRITNTATSARYFALTRDNGMVHKY